MNVELNQASGGLPAYGHTRSGTSWSRLRGRLSGVLASVIFPSDCRICESLTDDGRPAAHLRRLSGIVSPEPAGELRCLRRAVGRARGQRRGICDLPAVGGTEICVRAGTPLWPVGRRAGTRDPAVELCTHRAAGPVVCRALARSNPRG